MKSTKRIIIIAALTGLATQVIGATFEVPTDERLVRMTEAIVVGTVISSHAEWHDRTIRTVTELSVEEIIKGNLRRLRSLQIMTPGGVVESTAYVVPGSPRFEPDDHVLVFLQRDRNGDWTVQDLTLGKFKSTVDSKGRLLLVREEGEIVGWNEKGEVHAEKRRLQDPFLNFVRKTASGRSAVADYFVDKAPLTERELMRIAPMSHLGDFPPSSYLLSGRSRWGFHPQVPESRPAGGVKPFYHSNLQPGAVDGGLKGLRAGLAAWTDDLVSDLHYRHGGLTVSPQRINAADNINGVAFEDPFDEITGIFPATSNVLGRGGFWTSAQEHSFLGESFPTIIEGNMVTNNGVSTWSGIATPRFDQLMAHELGHTWGSRHSDQNEVGGPCAAPLPCDTAAIMRSAIAVQYGAVLQPWDADGMRTVYRGADNFSFEANFDGDTINDRVVFRPTTGQWWIMRSTGGVQVVSWGTAGDVPVAADYDGDNITDVAVWRVSTGTWWIIRSTGGAIAVPWGAPSDLPVPGDYDGDGRADIAVWRPSTGEWWIQRSTGGNSVQPWGTSGDKTVQADYDGDGRTDLAIWRPSTGEWWIIRSSGGHSVTPWGAPTDIPVPGRYDGDLMTDLAVFRISDAVWWVIRSTGGSEAEPFGTEGDRPVVGDQTGDGRADRAIWRPWTGDWWVRNSNTGAVTLTHWGGPGDTPIGQASAR